LVGLGDRRHDPATALPYGAQRRLEVARSLASEPRLVMLDEPTAGMNENEVRDMIQLIQTIRDQGRTVLLIEHNMPVVMGISDRIAVLSFGRKLAEGSADAIRKDPDVISAYLGAPTTTPSEASEGEQDGALLGDRASSDVARQELE